MNIEQIQQFLMQPGEYYYFFNKRIKISKTDEKYVKKVCVGVFPRL